MKYSVPRFIFLGGLFGNKTPQIDFEKVPRDTIKYLEDLKKKCPGEIDIWSEESIQSLPEVIKKDLLGQGAIPVASLFYDPKYECCIFNIWYDPKTQAYAFRDGESNFGWGIRKSIKDALRRVLEISKILGVTGKINRLV